MIIYPQKQFLEKKTLNAKVNNWAVEIFPNKIKFEYIKGIKNTLADTMSRLIKIVPDTKPLPKPECYIVGLGLNCKFIDLLFKRLVITFIKISFLNDFIVLEIIYSQTDTLTEELMELR